MAKPKKRRTNGLLQPGDKGYAAYQKSQKKTEKERDRIWSELWEDTKDRPVSSISTMRELIAALGGPAVLKAWLITSRDECVDWTRHGYVPRGYSLMVYLALTNLGYEQINPELFGFPDWEDVRLPHMKRPVWTKAAQRSGREA